MYIPLMPPSSSAPASPPTSSSSSSQQPQTIMLLAEAHPFNTPSLKHNSKWRTVLAHFAPRRFLLAPFRSTTPSCITCPTANSSPLDIPSHVSNPPSHDTACESPVDVDTHTLILPLSATGLPERIITSTAHNIPFGATKTPGSTIADTSHIPLGSLDSTNIDTSHIPLRTTIGSPKRTVANSPDCNHLTFCNSPPFSSTDAAASDAAGKLLHMLLQMPYSNDINKRTRTLSALCTLCASSPGTADQCAAADGVKIVLDVLNSSTAQPSCLLPPAVAIVEESEKALLLLQLVTSFSKDGCASALLQSSSTIATLGKKLLRVSENCTASAIAVLTTLCRHSDAAAAALFCKAVSETAIPSKLVVVLQVATKESTKRKAGTLLRLLGGQELQQPS